jgi:iron complex outermembrane receptor protein
MKLSTAFLLTTVSFTSLAQVAPDALNTLSLENLMEVEVTSVSKKPQKLATVAAAVYVITAEDIRLSGASSIPEVLRLAPGVDATRISGNRWAVSIRGFASRTSNKLLVLIDGRSAYSPSFSGVVWEDFQFPLEDIERIEVIRGPSSAVWGSNGVNGVINIITKSAAATQGESLLVGNGTVDGTYARFQHGAQNVDGSVIYRVYASKQDANSQKTVSGGDGMDSFQSDAAGFRMDGYLTNGARWDISGDIRSLRSDIPNTFFLPNINLNTPTRVKNEGQTLRARYTQPMDDGSIVQAQLAYAHIKYDEHGLINDQRDTIDLDVQHHLKLGKFNDLVWGAEFRVSSDNIRPTPLLVLDETSRRTNNFGFFVQDEIAMAEHWRLNLGLRMDHNEFTGWESQPDARLSWQFMPNQTLWSSVSKAARAPSRGENGFTTNYIFEINPVSKVPTVAHLRSAGIVSENLIANQLGLRSQWMPSLATDTVLFSHKYSRLASMDDSNRSYAVHMNGTVPDYIDAYIRYTNNGELTLNGAELSVDWRPAPYWNLRLSQSWQKIVSDSANIPETVASISDQITSIQASWSMASHVDLNLWLRRTGARKFNEQTTFLARNAHTGVDLSLIWRLQKNWDLTLVGQNLNNGACDAIIGVTALEAIPKLLPTCVPRSMSGQLRLNF